jgi:hypothetical protein
VRHSYVNNDPGGADSSITKTSAAQANGLAIYCSEWGETDGSGGITDPTLNLPAANEWIAWCQAHGVGGMNKWSISHLTQGSAVLLPGASALGGWDPETDLKPSGIYIRNKIREINGGGSSTNYLDQAADLGAYRVRSVNNWTMADGTSFTFFGAIETPSAWLSPAVNQYVFTTGINNYAFLRIRDSDRKLLFRLYDSSFVKICEMLSTATMSLSTKYLIGISWDSTAGNQMYINGSAAALDSSVNVGGTAKLTDDKLTLGGRAADDTMNLNGRLGPMWFKGARDDFTTAWIDYYDGTGFVDAANGALTRMAWADLNSDGTDSAAFEVPGGSVTLEDWVVPEGFSVNFDGVPLTFDSVQVRFT